MKSAGTSQCPPSKASERCTTTSRAATKDASRLQTQTTTTQPRTSIYKDASVTIGRLESYPNTGGRRSCPTPFAHAHGSDHWHFMACKRESCPVCGRRRRASFVRRAAQCTYLKRHLRISPPDHGEPSRERLRFINRKCAELKQYLDRQYGKQPPATWSNERDEVKDNLHSHRLLGDYGYIDFPKVRKWMVKRGMCSPGPEGKLIPWSFKYELLRNQGQAIAYVAKYISKAADQPWPKYARRRYCPVPEKREPSRCGPHKVKLHCGHLESRLRPALTDRIALTESERLQCADCLMLIRSALAAWTKTQPPASVPSYSSLPEGSPAAAKLSKEERDRWYDARAASPLTSMFPNKDVRHRVLLLPVETGKEGVK